MQFNGLQFCGPSQSAGRIDSLRGLSRFRPHERLRSSSDYAKVKQEGKRRRTRHFGVNFAPNGLAHHRLGLIVQKRYWNAVQRNRIKRRIREWFRLHKNEIPHPFLDIVLIARPGAEKYSLDKVAIEIMSVFDGGNISGS